VQLLEADLRAIQLAVAAGDFGRAAELPKLQAALEQCRQAQQRLVNERRPAAPSAPAVTQDEHPAFPYSADEADHCETPLEAYQDVAPMLRMLAQDLGVKPKKLRIYDPYYCGGTVKNHFRSLGFPICYNEMEDFYAFAEGSTNGPGDYDVLVTNPPYSGDHVERLLQFCAKQDKPCFLLMPHYFYTKPYFKETIGAPSAVSSLFFLCPGVQRRYKYLPPQWADATTGSTALAKGKETNSPFPSFWYCSTGKHTKKLTKRWRAIHEPADANNRLAIFSSHMFIARTTGDLPQELRSEFDTTKKRANPKARKKLAKRKREMSGR
jgi:hypothetical protein